MGPFTNFCSTRSSLMLCSVNSGSLRLPKLLSLISSTSGVFWSLTVSLLCAVAWKLNHKADLFYFLTHRYHCRLLPDNPVSSKPFCIFCPIFCYCSQESKFDPYYSILAKDENLNLIPPLLPFYPSHLSVSPL